MRYAVILAGGWGERLWPMSRRSKPKQFLELAGEGSLVRQALDRIAPEVDVGRTLVLTGMVLRDRMLAELADVPPGRIIGEPVGRNTAPAIALAAHLLRGSDDDAIMIVLPADHVITDAAAFRKAIDLACRAAEDERSLVTLGIRPSRAETEYGYIKVGGRTAIDGVMRVERFTEKPDVETAECFLADGGYLWNSGMFIWRADALLGEVARQLPEVAMLLDGVTAGPGDDGFVEQVAAFYEAAPSISIDYGVMESASDVMVVPAAFGWDDVGAWSALGRVWETDDAGNATSGEVLLLDSKNCVAHGTGGVVAAVGMSDVVVVHTPGATLVCPADRSRDVRKIVEELRRRGRTEEL